MSQGIFRKLNDRSTTDTVVGERDLSRSELFDILSNPRRRCIVRLLLDQEEMDVDELIDRVAAWENDKAVADVTAAERKRVYTALQQTHMPKLVEMGLIEHDRNRGVVTTTTDFDDLDVYLQVMGGTNVPYSAVYLLLTAFAGLLTAGIWFAIPPITLLPGVVWIGILVGVFGIASMLHLHYSRQMKLNPGDVLSEIEP